MEQPRIDLPGEEWRPVLGFEARYEISNLGRVWSCYGNGRRGTVSNTGRVMKLLRSRTDYDIVFLRRPDGTKFTAYVHSLVCGAFNGPRPDGMVCAHLDGSRDNNVPSNLAWVTQLENQRHRELHGTKLPGEKNPFSKITADDVLAIRRRVAAGEQHVMLAREYGLNKSWVGKIVHRQAWRHL